MTNKDVIIQILIEITGWSKADADILADKLRAANPTGEIDLCKELTEDDALALLKGLHKEKDNIKIWLIKSGLLPVSEPGTA